MGTTERKGAVGLTAILNSGERREQIKNRRLVRCGKRVLVPPQAESKHDRGPLYARAVFVPRANYTNAGTETAEEWTRLIF